MNLVKNKNIMLNCLGIIFYIASFLCFANKNHNDEITVYLQLPWKHQFEFAGFYAAIEQGYYQEQGINVIPVEYEKGMDLTAEVLSGRAQYGVSDSSLMVEKSKGADVVLLANIFQHSPMVLLSRKESKIYSPVQLVGKTMMLSSHEKNNAAILAMLNSVSMSLDQINVVEHSFNLEDFVTGKVDVISAYATNEPGVLKERQVPFNLIDPINFGIDLYGNNIFTSQQELQAHPERVAKFIKASLRGWQYALDHPEPMIDLILTKYSSEKTAKALVFEAQALKRYILAEHIPLGSINLGRMERIVTIYKQLKMLPKEFELDDFIYQAEAESSPLILNLEQQNWIKQYPKIAIGVDSAWAPFEFIDEQGNYAGMGADYIELIAKMTGIDFVVQDNPNWQAVMDNAQRGTLDLLPAIMKSPQRSEFLDFSKPHINYPMVIVSAKEKDFIGSLEQLKDKKVTVVKGYVTEDILRINHPEIELVPAENLEQALKMVASEDVAALVDNLASVSYTISKLGISNLRISSTTPYEFALSIAAPKNNKILLSIIQKALDNISPAEHKAIRNKWIAINYTEKVDYKNILQIAVIAIVFILVILLWNWRLSKEIDARKKVEKKLSSNQQVLLCKNNILELLSKSTNLEDILETLIQSLEQLNPDMIGSVLMLDAKTNTLHSGVAVSLPASYMEAVDGMSIGLGRGSCGTSAYTGMQVIVSDIMTHPYWAGFKELAQAANLGACWSQPVKSSAGDVLATFAIYYREAKEPNQKDLDLIHEFTILTSLVIEHFQRNELLKKLSLAVEQTANAIIITDKSGIIEYVNPKFTDITGYQAQEVIGQIPSILKSSVTKEKTYTDLWNTLLAGKKWQGEFCNCKKNGELYWAWDNISPIINNGEVTHFVAVQEDITARKKAEQQLITSEAQYRNLIEGTHVVAWELDFNTFCFTYVSPHAEKMLGYPVEKWKEEQFWVDHVYEEDRQESVDFCINASREGRDHDFEYRMVKANGDLIWLRDIVTVNKNLQGEPVSLRGILIDIDSEKQAEGVLELAKQQAEQANKVKTEFLATMTHELRTPMNGVLGMAQILEDTPLNHEQRESVGIILSSGNALLDIINDVLDLSKLDAEQLSLDVVGFDLQIICQEVLDMFLAETKTRNLKIIMDYCFDCARYYQGDPQRIKQILINLVGNAVKFTSEGTITLRVLSEVCNQQAELRFEIKDTGVGIAKSQQVGLFEPFVQVDQSSTRKFSGSGLGLSVSKRLVLLMGGEIGVNSSLGNGTEFWFTLSLPTISKESVIDNSFIIDTSKKLLANILLVEDDKINQLVAVKMLQDIGLHVDSVENGERAVEQWQQGQYDLIFMDCRMPVLDGYAASQKIRELETANHIPIIALTANSSLEDKKQCLESGMNDVLTKPFKKQQLYTALKQWLDNIETDEQNGWHTSNLKGSPVFTENNCVNEEVFNKFRHDMAEDFDEIYKVILQGFNEFFNQFSVNLTTDNAELLARSVHNLKSRSLHLGAVALAGIAAEIETLADNKNIRQASIKIQQLKQEYERVLVYLKKENA